MLNGPTNGLGAGQTTDALKEMRDRLFVCLVS